MDNRKIAYSSYDRMALPIYYRVEGANAYLPWIRMDGLPLNLQKKIEKDSRSVILVWGQDKSIGLPGTKIAIFPRYDITNSESFYKQYQARLASAPRELNYDGIRYIRSSKILLANENLEKMGIISDIEKDVTSKLMPEPRNILRPSYAGPHDLTPQLSQPLSIAAKRAQDIQHTVDFAEKGHPNRPKKSILESDRVIKYKRSYMSRSGYIYPPIKDLQMQDEITSQTPTLEKLKKVVSSVDLYGQLTKLKKMETRMTHYIECDDMNCYQSFYDVKSPPVGVTPLCCMDLRKIKEKCLGRNFSYKKMGQLKRHREIKNFKAGGTRSHTPIGGLIQSDYLSDTLPVTVQIVDESIEPKNVTLLDLPWEKIPELSNNTESSTSVSSVLRSITDTEINFLRAQRPSLNPAALNDILRIFTYMKLNEIRQDCDLIVSKSEITTEREMATDILNNIFEVGEKFRNLLLTVKPDDKYSLSNMLNTVLATSSDCDFTDEEIRLLDEVDELSPEERVVYNNLMNTVSSDHNSPKLPRSKNWLENASQITDDDIYSAMPSAPSSLLHGPAPSVIPSDLRNIVTSPLPFPSTPYKKRVQSKITSYAPSLADISEISDSGAIRLVDVPHVDGSNLLHKLGLKSLTISTYPRKIGDVSNINAHAERMYVRLTHDRPLVPPRSSEGFFISGKQLYGALVDHCRRNEFNISNPHHYASLSSPYYQIVDSYRENGEDLLKQAINLEKFYESDCRKANVKDKYAWNFSELIYLVDFTLHYNIPTANKYIYTEVFLHNNHFVTSCRNGAGYKSSVCNRIGCVGGGACLRRSSSVPLNGLGLIESLMLIYLKLDHIWNAISDIKSTLNIGFLEYSEQPFTVFPDPMNPVYDCFLALSDFTSTQNPYEDIGHALIIECGAGDRLTGVGNAKFCSISYVLLQCRIKFNSTMTGRITIYPFRVSQQQMDLLKIITYGMRIGHQSNRFSHTISDFNNFVSEITDVLSLPHLQLPKKPEEYCDHIREMGVKLRKDLAFNTAENIMMPTVPGARYAFVMNELCRLVVTYSRRYTADYRNTFMNITHDTDLLENGQRRYMHSDNYLEINGVKISNLQGNITTTEEISEFSPCMLTDCTSELCGFTLKSYWRAVEILKSCYAGEININRGEFNKSNLLKPAVQKQGISYMRNILWQHDYTDSDIAKIMNVYGAPVCSVDTGENAISADVTKNCYQLDNWAYIFHFNFDLPYSRVCPDMPWHLASLSKPVRIVRYV